jgi:hypothetical protein
MTRLIGVRERAPGRITEAADLRNRAFTLFLRTYNQARRAVQYLRFDVEDADDITPVLYPGKRRRKRRRAAEAAAQATTALVAAPPVRDAMTGEFVS